MSIPIEFQASKFPEAFDTDTNLYLTHDSLRVVLIEDYDPTTSTSIVVEGDISLFPANGIITLTEQCSNIGKRAVSFFYKTKTANGFSDLTVLSGFDNTIVRPKKITFVTQNVMASHHNSLKDALIAIEEFVGVKGTTDTQPFGETMEGRINFLRKLVLSPRAWFTADKRIGLVPLEVTFKNESFRLGDGDVVITWDFGDADSSIPISNLSTISVTSVTPISTTDVRVQDLDSGTIVKTYTEPNFYTVKLTVENEFGSDTVVFEDFINARVKAPIEAIITFSPRADQIYTPGSPSGGPYTISKPKIRSKTNQFINIEIPDGINGTTLRTYAGEEVIGSTPIDPIDNYSWELGDDLAHANQNATRASYSIGGIYDMILRCDTRYGSYRISNYESSIDIVEDRNLWLFTKNGSTATHNEFGLISETFKVGTSAYTILANEEFLDGTNNETQAKREFNRNVAFAANGTTPSGSRGLALIMYASGGTSGSVLSDQTIKFVDFDGFAETILDNIFELNRPWNWINFTFDNLSYFAFGPDPVALPDENLATVIKDSVELGPSLTNTQSSLVNPDNFINGAAELLQHVTSSYDNSGEPLNGRFAVYRSATKGHTGYFLRNDSVGTFFKLRDFYRTEGTSADPVTNFRKLADMSGSVKEEGQLVGLTNGLFFFNNSGKISAYNTADSVWETGNSTAPFRAFQDNNVENYDSTSNTLLAASDGERTAYLSFDYSPNAFIKYNSVDLTFSGLGQRPEGDQWVAGIY